MVFFVDFYKDLLKIKYHLKILESGKGYTKTIWSNFGRTVEEGSLKAFSDFAEQILDGMLDDNFGNTGTGDFVPLPYISSNGEYTSKSKSINRGSIK